MDNPKNANWIFYRATLDGINYLLVPGRGIFARPPNLKYLLNMLRHFNKSYGVNYPGFDWLIACRIVGVPGNIVIHRLAYRSDQVSLFGCRQRRSRIVTSKKHGEGNKGEMQIFHSEQPLNGLSKGITLAMISQSGCFEK
jgi:hypothetical protein